MSDPDVFLLIMDIQNNILILLNNQYTTLLSSKITKNDKSLINDPNMLAKIITLRLIKDKLKLLTSHERLDDISLYDQNGNKLNVFIHRINDEEKKLILANNISESNFININTLPKNLDTLSSSIIQTITNYPELILNTTKPPSSIPITYPTDIQKFIPSMQVPLLKPKNELNNKQSSLALNLATTPAQTLATTPAPTLATTPAQTFATTPAPTPASILAPTIAPPSAPLLRQLGRPLAAATGGRWWSAGARHWISMDTTELPQRLVHGCLSCACLQDDFPPPPPPPSLMICLPLP
jgi:hypothetical protein